MKNVPGKIETQVFIDISLDQIKHWISVGQHETAKEECYKFTGWLHGMRYANMINAKEYTKTYIKATNLLGA